MTDRYPNGDPTVEKLSLDFVKRRLATASFAHFAVGTFVRTDDGEVLVSIPPTETGGTILPATQIVAQGGIAEGRVADAGWLKMMSTESFAEIGDVTVETVPANEDTEAEAVVIVYGHELPRIIGRRSALSAETASKFSRQYTGATLESMFGEKIRIILQRDEGNGENNG